jgi:hypothetical protein
MADERLPVQDTDTVDWTFNPPTDCQADVKKQMSIVSDANGLKLDGDAASPGNSKLYGTNASGVKGFYDQSAGAQVGDLIDFKFVRKSSDQSVTSSTALVVDSELIFAIGANETWQFELVILHLGAEAGDFKMAVKGPSGVAGIWSAFGAITVAVSGAYNLNAGARSTWDNSATLAFGNQGASALSASANVKGVARNGATPGNIELWWAQNTSDATGTTIKTDSYLIARRVA